MKGKWLYLAYLPVGASRPHDCRRGRRRYGHCHTFVPTASDWLGLQWSRTPTHNLWPASNDADSLEDFMKICCVALLVAFATAAFAMPVPSSARSMVPAEIQQVIGVD